jgi:hypothetical protein
MSHKNCTHLNKILFIDLQNLGKIIYLYALLQKYGIS